MSKTAEETNKALVLEAFDTLFNKRDYKAAERYWSSNYIQHSAHIPPGREGLFNLIRRPAADAEVREHHVIAADKDFVIVHGRFSGHGNPRRWIAADIRMAGGLLAEHWDVIEDEATRAESQSGRPMFGSTFPE